MRIVLVIRTVIVSMKWRKKSKALQAVWSHSGKLSRSKSFRRLEYGSQEHRRRAMAWRMRGNTIEYIEGGAEQDEADRSRPVMGARGKAHYSDWLLT
jgi:hypothetical protein